ncbi:MAG: cysteine hydrolase [Burkholderiales bacterium]|nr:MAG: cysteine hydrolase [Burkholderiales bacterium]
MSTDTPADYGIDPVIVARMRERRGRLHVFDALQPERVALVVIDMQVAFLEAGAPVETPPGQSIVPNINRLAGALRDAGGTVAWVQALFERGSWPLYFDTMVRPELAEQVLAALSAGAPGQALWPQLAVEPSDLRVTKRRYSAFFPGACPLPGMLRERGIDTVLIAGVLTNVCCEASARDAMMGDFRVVMVADANAARSAAEHAAALGTVIQFFGDVRDTGEVVAMLEAGRR